jgi:hypothetical protein
MRSSSPPLSMIVARLALAAAATACATPPEPPPVPSGVVELAQRYDNATATIDAASARRIADAMVGLRTDIGPYTGLFFVRNVVEDATMAAESQTELPVDVQGSLFVHAPCPGWDAAVEPTAADGFVELTIGVDGSRAQRAFAGSARACRFVSNLVGMSLEAQLELDLGDRLGLGEPLPPMLVRATNVTLTSSSGQVWQLPELHFRLRQAGVLELLVDLGPLGLGVAGTAVVAFHADGSLALRVREGAWVCAADWSLPCALTG